MKKFKDFKKDNVLYHASYITRHKNIMQHGLLSNPPHKNWDFSENKVYLDKDPHSAISYAETAEEVPDKDYNSGIIVYKINKNDLDPSKLHLDNNNHDKTTLEYHDNIDPKFIKIHSKHET